MATLHSAPGAPHLSASARPRFLSSPLNFAAPVRTACTGGAAPGIRGLRLSSGTSTFVYGEGRIRFALRARELPRQRMRFAVRANLKEKDYYATLNLNRSATLQEIKSSYKNLARKYHPDMNKSPGSEEKFKEISAAYEVLSDDEKRSLYDRYGESGLQGEAGGAGPQGMDPFEVFDSFFGESSAYFGGINFNRRSARNQNLDIRCDLSLSFEESVFGGRKDVDIVRFETCDKCKGAGAKSSSSIKSCSECGGRGGVMKSQRTPFGIVSQVTTCSKCDGNGRIITDHCPKCSGEGRLKKTSSIKIDVPPGVSDGVTMQFQGEGNVDEKRGIAGDLYLFIQVKEKPGFRRDGLNLYSNVCIDYTEAILGTVVEVETVEGYKQLRIPSGTQPGETIKIPKLGVPNMKKPSVRGDHHFLVTVQIPKEISDMERALVKELALLRSSLRMDQQAESQGSPKTNKNSHERHQGQQSKDSKPALWSSLKGFFGQGHSHSRFATISLTVPFSAPISCSAVHALPMVSICILFVLTCILSSASRVNNCAWPPWLACSADRSKKKVRYK